VTGEPQLPLEVLDLLTWLRVERGRSANTLAAYRRDLIAYVQWLRQRSVSIADVSEPDVNAYIGYLRESGRAPSSQKRALVAVRSLHRFLAEEHEGRPDPAAEVEVPRVPRGLPKALTEAEVESLLASVDGTDAVARRDRAILELLYGTGLRISELVGVSLSDIDIDAGLLRAFGKGSKERVVPLGRYCVVALVDWLGASGRAELIPDQWARRSDSDAGVLESQGRSLVSAGGMDGGEAGRRQGWARSSAVTPRSAPLLCHAHGRPRGRHSYRPGTSGSRQHQHYPGVHDGLDRTTVVGLSPGTPPGPRRYLAEARRPLVFSCLTSRSSDDDDRTYRLGSLGLMSRLLATERL
jgi:integrase/recombinase XerD